MEGGSRPEASWVVCYAVVGRVVVETILSPMPFHTINETFQFCNCFCFIHYHMFACMLIYCTLLTLIPKHGWLAIFVLTKYSQYSNILNKMY